MEKIQADFGFKSPSLEQLEQVADQAFRWERGRILIDLWDIEKFSKCEDCRSARVERLREMNETQTWVATIECDRCDTD